MFPDLDSRCSPGIAIGIQRLICGITGQGMTSGEVTKSGHVLERDKRHFLENDQSLSITGIDSVLSRQSEVKDAGVCEDVGVAGQADEGTGVSSILSA